MYKELTLEEGNKILIPINSIVAIISAIEGEDDIINAVVYTKGISDHLDELLVQETYASLKFLLLADPSKGD